MNRIYRFNYRLLKAVPDILNIKIATFADNLGVSTREVENWFDGFGFTFEKLDLMCRIYRLNPTHFVYVDDDDFEVADVKDCDYIPLVPHFSVLLNEVISKSQISKRKLSRVYGIGRYRYKQMKNNERAAWTLTVDVLMKLVNLSRTDLNNIVKNKNGKFPHIDGYDFDMKSKINEDVEHAADELVDQSIDMVKEDCVDAYKAKVSSSVKGLEENVDKLFSEPEV